MEERIIIETDGEIDITMPKNIEDFNYDFDIYLHNTDECIGNIWLDRGSEPEFIKYYGNVGYQIKEEYNGHHYSLKALKLLKQVILRENIRTMLFSVLPENVASKKIMERFGARIICYRPVPTSHKLYDIKGEKVIIYKYDIGDEINETSKGSRHI